VPKLLELDPRLELDCCEEEELGLVEDEVEDEVCASKLAPARERIPSKLVTLRLFIVSLLV